MSSSYRYVPRAWTDREGARLVNSVENGFESSTLSCWIMLLQECTRQLQVPAVELALVPYYSPIRIMHHHYRASTKLQVVRIQNLT
jgi:hypothetical protein